MVDVGPPPGAACTRFGGFSVLNRSNDRLRICGNCGAGNGPFSLVGRRARSGEAPFCLGGGSIRGNHGLLFSFADDEEEDEEEDEEDDDEGG